MNPYQGGWPSPPPQPRPADQRGALFGIAVVVAVMLTLVALVSLGFGALKFSKSAVSGVATAQRAEGSGAPANVGADGAVRIGTPGAKVTVRAVNDLQCPACKAFMAANAGTLSDAAKSGTAVIEYHIIAFLDRASTTNYSSRAANASYCVANAGTANYQTWLATMFDRQPAEGGPGLPDSTLIDIARKAGYTDPSVATCITTREYDAFVQSRTKETLATGVAGTPAVYINNKKIDSPKELLTPNGLAPAITAAAR